LNSQQVYLLLYSFIRIYSIKIRNKDTLRRRRQ
jgi:hypothetical protein